MTELFLRSGAAWSGNVLGGEKPYAIVSHKCHRCSGTRRFEHWRHVEGGICFACGGSGMGSDKEEKLYTAEKLAKLNAASAKKAAVKLAKFQAAKAEQEVKAASQKEAFEAAHADELAWLRTVGMQDGEYKSGFCGDMLAKAEKWAEWSEAQAAAVAKAYAKAIVEAEKAAASKWVGEIGERIEAVVTVEREASFYRANQWSYNRDGTEEVFITTMRTEAGNALVVMSPNFREAVGSTLKIKGTVKEHKEWKGEAQTVLARVKSQVAA